MTDFSVLPTLVPSIRSPLGVHRHKFRVRAVFRSVVFVLLVAGFCIYGSLKGSSLSADSLDQLRQTDQQLQSWEVVEEVKIRLKENEVGEGNNFSTHRRLEEEKVAKASPTWTVGFYCVGVLYLFLALAIVCDEFFVPALEAISGPKHLNLSMDVAGATLMAAGGSAPELFTSLFGTFTESVVGFGTIVGSAVFNVLFVIGMCALFSKEELKLTWWPLFRDSLYYAIGLIVLTIFVGVHGKGVIQMWEAIVLFSMYFGYVLIMYFNRRIYTFITGEQLVLAGESDGQAQESYVDHPRGPRWPSTFRAGVMKLLRDPNSWVVTAGVGIVSKMAGDVDAVFKDIDRNLDGFIDKTEFNTLFENLDCNASKDEIEAAFKEIDEDQDGVISEKEFTIWYTHSEERIKERVKETFDLFDSNRSGTIERNELKNLLEKIEPRVTEKDIDEAIEACYKDGSKEEITSEEFSDWYLKSLICDKSQKEVVEEFKGVCESLAPPSKGSCFDYIKWILVFPIIASLSLTVPDPRRPGMSKYCYFAFIMSIAWIGGYSYFMVKWAETIGATFGIPSMILGLTFLAAGTSVPDLLTSVIVARMGEGDMAVSSSIGSNIFDILVGLPVPWILYTAWPSKPNTVQITANNIWISILVLLGMLTFIIVSIHFQGWKLTKTLGYMMFVAYFLFLIQAILVDKYVKMD
mmetsp:Transcript_8208/g.7740  ORF Transcript_8208/g.7740 Transcript_8208/m.7740 type:complete len:690 (-) Transcript_8208:36-2105(-)|eukprot:CAMPEP_0197823050 /NCGR_PEP_ID=MMETSP1437-20131217/370_1 /TAXON_ID=49252 ORGANISM="Eucampia antarctica, Strain CCMP1452" /NCGR_SAMPLE_ID=MMETSP1437 /ASSEMBLY_ACC=CAM_ASM_001096 /LENGTH=689 /DNA_ID=CAMNT_0043422003 /DNA_START=177 /DNA_END=2246 /DNA_ORIENTATION=-